MLLMAEGQTPPNPAVGGTIVDGALKLGRPSMALISDVELGGMVFSPNLTALDKRIGQDTIAYMLDLRAKGGQIGRQFEQLYAARRGGDIHSLSAELIKRGVFVPSQMLNSDAIKYLLATCETHYQPGGYVVFDDPLFSSCIGAFDAMAESFVRERALLPEQVYPHFVFRPKGVGAAKAAGPSP